jgi:hypothetical protein
MRRFQSDQEMNMILNPADSLRKRAKTSQRASEILVQSHFPASMNAVCAMLRAEYDMDVDAGVSRHGTAGL